MPQTPHIERHFTAGDSQSGSVTVIQRFGSGLQLNVHAHTLAVDGVFTEVADGTLSFHPGLAAR